jgi:hypothetical protein
MLHALMNGNGFFEEVAVTVKFFLVVNSVMQHQAIDAMRKTVLFEGHTACSNDLVDGKSECHKTYYSEKDFGKLQILQGQNQFLFKKLPTLRQNGWRLT